MKGADEQTLGKRHEARTLLFVAVMAAHLCGASGCVWPSALAQNGLMIPDALLELQAIPPPLHDNKPSSRKFQTTLKSSCETSKPHASHARNRI